MRRPPRTRALAVAGVAALLALGGALAQVPPAPRASAPSAVPTVSAPPRPAREEGVRWQALTPSQREVLAPLERDWPGIDAARKQKWIALVARYKTLSPEERARISARMSEWARLTPAERGQARIRFEEARQLPAPDRSARWRAYQALPPERRQELAARAASAASAPRETAPRPARPASASKEAKVNVVPNPTPAAPPRQVAPTLVQAGPGATTTPVTRKPAPPPHQPSGQPKIAATPEFVNRSTLLPKRGPQAAAVTPPGAAVAPPSPTPATAPARPLAASVPLPARPAAASSPR